MAERILYDGKASSVERIMQVVGTSAVNNTSEGYCFLPHGERIWEGDYLVFENNFWWVERRHPMAPNSMQQI